MTAAELLAMIETMLPEDISPEDREAILCTVESYGDARADEVWNYATRA